MYLFKDEKTILYSTNDKISRRMGDNRGFEKFEKQNMKYFLLCCPPVGKTRGKAWKAAEGFLPPPSAILLSLVSLFSEF